MLSGLMRTTVALGCFDFKDRPSAMLELGLTTNTPLFQPSGIFKIIFKRNTRMKL